jgi:tetratricopeptide (TPR) repeat protein
VPPPSTIARSVKAAEGPAEDKPTREPKKKPRRWPWVAVAIGIPLCLIMLVFGFLFARQRILRNRQARESQSAGQLLEQAQAARANGDLEHALELYEMAVQTDPQMVPAYIQASELLLEMERGEEALGIIMRGVEANPGAPNVHTAAAGTALLLGKLDAAQGEIEWMLRQIPDDPLTHTFDGILLLEQGHPCDEARPALEKARRAEPDLAWGHYGMALCLAQEGNLDSAREEVFFVLDHPETPPPLRRLAEELLARLDEAPPPDGGKLEPADEAVLNEFDVLMNMAQDVEDEGLRQYLKEMLNEARMAWKEGDKERSLRLVEELIPWVEGNADGLNPEQARMLTLGLRNILRLAQ